MFRTEFPLALTIDDLNHGMLCSLGSVRSEIFIADESSRGAKHYMLLLRRLHRATSYEAKKSATLDLALLCMRLVSFNDHLHQLVPDHVFVAEVNKVDAIDAGQNTFSL